MSEHCERETNLPTDFEIQAAKAFDRGWPKIRRELGRLGWLPLVLAEDVIHDPFPQLVRKVIE